MDKYDLCIMKYLIILLSLTIGLISCKKDSEEWVWCNDCAIDDIAGHYEGKATYVHLDSEIRDENQVAYLQITKLGETSIRVLTGIENRIAINMSGAYNNTYYITLDSETQFFSANILQHNGQIRIQGSAKRLVYDNKTESYITRDYIDIDMYKSAGND
jgi:hypothetical protein